MRTGSQRPEAGKWTPLIVLPLIYAITFALWLFLAPAFAIAGRIGGFGQGFAANIAMGCYLALFLVHSVMFIVFRPFRINLMFALLCLTMFLYTAVAHRGYVLLSPTLVLDWLAQIRIEHFTLPVIGVLAVGIIYRLFPGVFPKWFLYMAHILMAAFAVIFVFADGELLGWSAWGCLAILGVIAIYALIRLAVKLRRIHVDQVVFVVGAVILLYSVISDILKYLVIDLGFLSFLFPFMRTGYLAENAMLLFSFAASAVFLIAASRGIRDSGGEKHLRAAKEMIAENQLDFQREQYGQLMASVESARFMRHDMKHHLAVISEYAEAGNLVGIKGYMEGLFHGLSSARGKTYCENYAVNAIVTHYLSLAESDGVEVKVKLTVPADTGRVRDSDLCVIVGNLLENAVEGSKKAAEGSRFIRLFSYVQDDNLTFTMENSFDGEAKAFDGSYYSRKREGRGIGLSSVQAVAEKYDGAAKFEARGRMFLSSVYVVL